MRCFIQTEKVKALPCYQDDINFEQFLLDLSQYMPDPIELFNYVKRFRKNPLMQVTSRTRMLLTSWKCILKMLSCVQRYSKSSWTSGVLFLQFLNLQGYLSCTHNEIDFCYFDFCNCFYVTLLPPVSYLYYQRPRLVQPPSLQNRYCGSGD